MPSERLRGYPAGGLPGLSRAAYLPGAMTISRRHFAARVTGLAGAAAMLGPGTLLGAEPDPCDLPAPIQAAHADDRRCRARSTDDERRARIAKAQRLMAEQGIGAIVLEPGTSMHYFTGVGWSPSERTFAMVHARRGATRPGSAPRSRRRGPGS